MKKISIIICSLVFVLACKKDGGSGKQLLLSKVYSNNLLAIEYTYSSDMKPVRRDIYSTGQGQSVFAGFRLYEYENGLLKEVLFYNKDNKLSDKHIITHNASGNVTRIDRYGAGDEISYYSVFQYDNGEHLSKMINYTTNPVKKNGEWQFEYDGLGQIISLRRYTQNMASLQLFDSAHFTYSGKELPSAWDYYEQLPSEFPGDNTFLCMAVSSYYYYMPGGPPTSSTHTLTEKKYNDRGYITGQQYKIEGDNGLGPFTISYDLKYEYIE